jgi:ATP-binding cassette subfamily G (WHITE) protein 2 (PDR)
MVNEFSGRTFDCSSIVPSGPAYAGAATLNQVCNAVGAVPGSNSVSGEAYLNSAYGYEAAHKWRNIGILFAFLFGLLGWHLLTTGMRILSLPERMLTSLEYITAARSKGEVLLFPRGQVPDISEIKDDVESQNTQSRVQEKGVRVSQKPETTVIEKQTAIFSWKDVVYDIKIKNEPRRILDHVDGWVKPGTLTALMVSTF